MSFLARTPAQRAYVAQQKRKMWHERRVQALPPLSEEEAQRLINEYLATHDVTRLPSARAPYSLRSEKPDAFGQQERGIYAEARAAGVTDERN